MALILQNRLQFHKQFTNLPLQLFTQIRRFFKIFLLKSFFKEFSFYISFQVTFLFDF